jgi:hypothetical protein
MSAHDALELARIQRAGEAESRQLVERRARGGERGKAAGDRRRESTCVRAPPGGREGAVAGETRVGALDPGRERGAGEQHGWMV